MDFTDDLQLLEPNRKMVASWLISSGLSFVVAMKSHLALLAIIRSISVQSRLKGAASTEEEALHRIRMNKPGLLICSDQLAEGNGFSLCRRAIQSVGELKVLMVLSGEGGDVNLALESGAMAVVDENDFLSHGMEVLRSVLAATNGKKSISILARSQIQKPGELFEPGQSLTSRESEILALLFQGLSDMEVADQLQLSIHTVKEHGKSIRRKYNVKTRLQLISIILGGDIDHRAPSPQTATYQPRIK
jgi:DNA-binding NarL/FixJ family response regulator